MKIAVVLLNSIGLLAFLVLLFDLSWLAPLGTASRVTELDRHQVIDVARLLEFKPELAQNIRSPHPPGLGAWIAEDERSAGTFAAWAGALLAAGNIAVAAFARHEKRDAAG
jgi:hypothetical protein